jgi:isoquinoline 1-oxidoreductase beta subunit
VTGRAVYGWDVRLPGLLVASVLHSPVQGGALRHFDARKAEAVAGVRRVVPLGSARRAEWTAIAVVADGFWSAQQGLEALDIEWDGGEHGAASTATIAALLRELAKERGTTVVYTGTPREAMGRATRRLGAVYETPYLAHVTMEPMSCTARVSGHTCELWVPTQNPTEARAVAARICHLPTSAVTVHQTYLGGGFGRRQRVDAVAEAVQLAKMVGAPVKVLWSRGRRCIS